MNRHHCRKSSRKTTDDGWITLAQMASLTGCSLQQTEETADQLVQLGVIEVEKGPPRRFRTLPIKDPVPISRATFDEMLRAMQEGRDDDARAALERIEREAETYRQSRR
jgi:hypothetical protein